MNNDLISREALKKCAIPCEIHNGALTDMCVPLYQIDNAPTVETEITNDDLQAAMTESYHLGYELAEAKFKRPQGKWKQVSSYTVNCSCCNKNCPDMSRYLKMNFCPNCGADMRGGEES